MHTQITATGLPDEVQHTLLDLRNTLDDLATDIENAAAMMWMLSGHDDLSTAQARTFRALESMTRRFAENVEAIEDVLARVSRGEPVPRKQ